jgi:hypothetical protein
MPWVAPEVGSWTSFAGSEWIATPQAVEPRRAEVIETLRRRCDRFIEKLSKNDA